jgi:hypothetical protein
MSSKKKQAEVPKHYFDDVRNYGHIAKAEEVFFKSLIAKRSELRTNYTLYQALEKANHFLGDPNGRVLDILVEFEVDDQHRQKHQKMHLGTLLCPRATGSDAQVTHFLCLSEDTDFLAKIHLDRDFSSNDPGGKPTPHIQVGGRVSASLAAKVSGAKFWRDDLDKPRIPSMPVCSALLWHWAFLEYRNDQNIIPFLGADWWAAIVREAEESVLKPFFEDGAKLIADKPISGLLNAFYTPVTR